MVIIGPVTPPEEGLIYTTNNTALKIDNRVVGKGKLYISQGALAWQADNIVNGISIMWKQVSIHGISTNPSKCIYFMLDHKLVWPGVYEGQQGVPNGDEHRHANNGHRGGAAPVLPPVDEIGDDPDEGHATDEEDLEEEEDEMTECWLIPDDINTVETMFQAMTECQALHPDSADSISDESDFMEYDGDDFDEAGDLGPGAGNGAEGGMRNLNLNDDRFADADE